MKSSIFSDILCINLIMWLSFKWMKIIQICNTVFFLVYNLKDNQRYSNMYSRSGILGYVYSVYLFKYMCYLHSYVFLLIIHNLRCTYFYVCIWIDETHIHIFINNLKDLSSINNNYHHLIILFFSSPFLLWQHVHNVKFTIWTALKCTVQWCDTFVQLYNHHHHLPPQLFSF